MKQTAQRSFSSAVIGLGYGDEGKGVSVNSLARFIPGSMVVRYNGGQQAGHTVTLEDGTSHVFSNFGSGTFQRRPTFWSKYCTFDPVGVLNEIAILIRKGYTPVLYVDKRCPVTTPFDKEFNQQKNHGHGTCGQGVGATLRREEKFYSLLAGDLLYPAVLRLKLEMIRGYYDSQRVVENFLACCELLMDHPTIRFVDEMPKADHYIFEGAQGLLLDQNIGFFPHVTPSNTGSKNILDMGFEPHLYLITRAFQTRHGNGPMSNAHLPHNIKLNPKETNTLNDYQGEFRRALLDLDMLKYGISRDEYIRNSKNRTLVITCLDLVKDEYRYTENGKIVCHTNEESFVKGIQNALDINDVRVVSSPYAVFEPNFKEEESCLAKFQSRVR